MPLALNDGIMHATVTAERNGSSVSSSGRSRVSSVPSSYNTSCGLGSVGGNFSCRSHIGGSSLCSYGNVPNNFSSHSCIGAFTGGGYRRRMSIGSCPCGNYGGYPHFGYADGLVEVGGGIVGQGIVGMDGDPGGRGIGFPPVDGKVLMQNLNDRLASYLHKVRRLEVENAELESQISHFYATQGHTGEPKDYSHYHDQIEELNEKIICTSVENNKIILNIDNNRLVIEDLRQKLATENGLCQNVEVDLSGLYPIFDQLTSCKKYLEDELEALQEEMCDLKKNHEEGLSALRKQPSDVNVEVSTSQGPDLKKILEEMRCKYEAMIDSNRKEVAKWYENKLEEVKQEVCNNNKDMEDGNQKVIDLRRQIQTLEIDLQTQYNLRDTMQASLAETECSYNTQLAEIQEHIFCIEEQLAELRLEMEGQNHEYKELLGVKNRLEQEIQTYHSLLDKGQENYGTKENPDNLTKALQLSNTNFKALQSSLEKLRAKSYA